MTQSNKRRRVLYLTTRVPYPPNRGDRIRSYHTLRFLSEHADVSLATLADESWSSKQERELNKYCEQLSIVPHWGRAKWVRAALSLVFGKSATEGLFSSSTLARIVKGWASENPFDAVLCFCSSMYQFSGAVSPEQTDRYVDFVDVDSEKWFGYAARSKGIKKTLYTLEARRNRRLEKLIVENCIGGALVSESEADVMRRYVPTSVLRGIGNGVDYEYFAPDPMIEVADHCVFVGGMDYQPNIDGVRWFARNVWPEVIRFRPQMKFLIVGRDPSTEVRRLADEYESIEVTGGVPDVRPFIAAARVVVAPLQIARGIQNKVLEAMAMAKPVIASPEALTGIGCCRQHDAIEAESPKEWVDVICELAERDEKSRSIGNNAREFVLKRHSWNAQLEGFLDLMDLR